MLNGRRANFIESRVQSLAAIPFHCNNEDVRPSLKVPDNAPVLRRRKYTRQQRKSLIIEPDIGLILAGGVQSSSSEDDKNGEENVPERRKYGVKRRMKKRFYSTSNLKTADGADESAQIGTKSLSVRDLNGDNIDFNNRDSVKKWTSQIFAELESIPSSRRGSMDVTRSLHIPPEVQIDFKPLEQPPSPTKRRRFPVFELDDLSTVPPMKPISLANSDVVGPNFLRDLLNASCSQYPESNCSDRLATSDTNTATQKASRASSFEWLNNSDEYGKANSVGKYEDSSSDEADREVALIGMSKEDAAKSKKSLEELERSVVELENLGNATWFPPPPPIPDDGRDYVFDSLPTTFRKRKTVENHRQAIGSVYENAALSDLLKQSRATKDNKIPSIQSMSIRIDKPFSLENLPMVQQLSKFNTKPAHNDQEVAKKNSNFALQLNDRDAIDACNWLRKAGFSKYADQFDEGKLPIKLASAKDHGILEADLRLLNRRISILNRCHAMKVDSVPMRRRMNNDYARIDPKSDDNSSGYSENWRYGGHHSQTWTRPSASDHVYSGSLARIPTSKPTWQPHPMAESSRTIDSRKVQRTDWYEAQNTRGRVNDIPDNASTTACVNELNSAKLQRSQSERIKDRARAIMKKMDLRTTNKRPKDPRSRPAPMAIGDPVLVSYDTPKNSIRSHHIDRPSILPERGRQLYQSSPFQTQSRSKSIAQNRRAGLVFMTPTSPDSGNTSFGYSDVTSSIASSRSNNYGDSRRRELSMPPPSRHRVNLNAPSFPIPFPDGTIRRRELMPFDSYLYPGNFIDRKYDDPMPDRIFDDHDQIKPTMETKKKDPNNISMFNDGYYTHEIKTTLPRHNGSLNGHSNGNGNVNGLLTKPENLKVNTEKIEPLSSSEEPIGKTTLTRRSDSGLGSSLSRSPSGPYTQRIRQSLLPCPTATFSGNSSAFSCCSWSSSNKQNEMYGSMRSNSIVDEPFFSDIELARSIDSLNLIEMTKLRKAAYLRLTSILERTVEGKVALVDPDQDELPSKNVWSVQRLIKRMKITDAKMHKESEDSVFGVGLDVVYNRTGYFLPRPILEVMNFLRNVASETIGIFRKNGVKSRIAELRAIIDSQAFPTSDVFVGENSLDSTQVHDVADLLKQYLRDLPEPLMTVKMSEVFANICSSVPDVDRFAALQYAIVLLPDENREALKTLLLFLKDVSRSSQVNNMTAQNLSVCFTPSLFQLSASRLDKVTPGSRRHKTVGGTGLPTEKEMKEAKACQLCLTMLIEYAQTVFMVPDCVDEHSEAEDDIPNLMDLGLKGPRSFLIDRVIDMIREHSDSWKSWVLEGTYRGIEISSKKPSDSHPLKTFRVWVDVPAAPKSVMMRILKERHLWDSSVINWRHVEYVSAPDTDIHQYVINETIGHPTKDCHVARFHSSGLTEIRGACAIAERSVKCAEDQLLGGVSATIFDQRFLIEPISGGQSRVNYIARVDLKGRSLHWYNKSFGSGMCRHVERLRDSFSLHDKSGPETNV